jgi:hypothetical protein
MYRITITKVESKQTTRQGAWVVIDERPWTSKELEGSVYSGQSNQQFLDKNPLKEIKGYAPDVSVTEEREIEVLKQNVEDLDIAAVIKAINKL